MQLSVAKLVVEWEALFAGRQGGQGPSLEATCQTANQTRVIRISIYSTPIALLSIRRTRHDQASADPIWYIRFSTRTAVGSEKVAGFTRRKSQSYNVYHVRYCGQFPSSTHLPDTPLAQTIRESLGCCRPGGKGLGGVNPSEFRLQFSTVITPTQIGR